MSSQQPPKPDSTQKAMILEGAREAEARYRQAEANERLALKAFEPVFRIFLFICRLGLLIVSLAVWQGLWATLAGLGLVLLLVALIAK